MEDNKEWRFPCPNCKSSSRLVQSVVDDDRGKNRIDVEEGAMSMQEMPIKSNSKQYGVGDEISALYVWNDICYDCGTVYIFKVTRDIKKMSRDISNLVVPKPGKKIFTPGRN
jgi:hypothetical protein